MREQIDHAGEDRESLPPALPAIPRTEFEADPGRQNWIPGTVEHGDGVLGDHQRDIALQALAQPGALSLQGICRWSQIDPHLVPADVDRVGSNIAGPGIERPTGRDIEAGMVPVAGQDTVLDGPAMQWEAHVRAAIVQGIDALALRDQQDRLPVERNGQAPGLLELV